MEQERTKCLIKKYSIDNNIDVQEAWDIFFFDEFIHRLSLSRYNDKFVLKGGFYLFSLINLVTRTTMDIDFKMIGKSNDDGLIKIFKEICQNNINSKITFELYSIGDITAETKYGGKTIKIKATYFNVKKIFSIDIGFGDVITPAPRKYFYTSKYTNETYNILSYPIETSIAEKFETIISKGINNSRMKDYVDLYFYSKMEYDVDILNDAMKNTFKVRNTTYDKNYIDIILEQIFSFRIIKDYYSNYCSKHRFAENIDFDSCKIVIYKILSQLKF